MLLIAPKGITSVSLAGTEYKVKKGEVEVPDEIGAALLNHGLTVKVVEEEETDADIDDKDQNDPPKAPDDKKKSDPTTTPPDDKAKNDAASGGDKNGK
jgi:hypothetical protein